MSIKNPQETISVIKKESLEAIDKYNSNKETIINKTIDKRISTRLHNN
jgi:hypothetical protein